MKEDLYKFEKKLWKKGYYNVCGTDEAGRGPLYGPVVAAAVILPHNFKCDGLTDSKKLTSKKRDLYYDYIISNALDVKYTVIDAKTIDEINILEASRKAMTDSINKLDIKPDYILTDAMKLNVNTPFEAIIKGDSKSISIAAASVIAKVTRDRIMLEEDKKHPEYDFKSHKGYPTKKHIALLEKYGIIDGYRTTYGPVKEILKKLKEDE